MVSRRSTLVLASCLLAISSCELEELGLQPSDQRVVLTPGGSATIRIDIARPESFDQAVHLKLFGVAPGIEATLSETMTTADHVTLTLVSTGDDAIDTSFHLKGWVGPHHELEPIAVSVQEPGEIVEASEEYAPGVTGEVKTLEMNGQDVTYEVIDGLAIVDGDIVLGRAADLEDTFRAATCNFGFNTEFHCSRWTDGQIGYRFANNWGDDATNAAMRVRILAMMEEWEAATGIRFFPRNSGQFLEFRNAGGCSSNVGRAVITGVDVQSISLSTSCGDGAIRHEIGHAIGLYHEQSRSDRDEHVVVDFGRVQDGKLHQFFQMGEYERDVGPYDFDSIMHYARWTFARNADACIAGDDAECAIRPHDPTVEIGVRETISEGDILGVYTLYPPEYEIVGATSGEASDRFFLALEFDTPVPDPDRIEWRSNRMSEPLGTGVYLDLRAADVPAGVNLITAWFRVADQPVTQATIALEISNDAPMVTLEVNNGEATQDLGHSFTVSALVSDTEDGACPPGTCTYTWTPTPTGTTDASVASFRFDTVGAHTISVDVADYGGVVGTASIEVDVVNTAPTAIITEPGGDIIVSEGLELLVRGVGEDVNSPTGVLPCAALQWYSSNAGDSFGSPNTGCIKAPIFDGPGTRTISLVATDGEGATSEPGTIEVTVAECGPDNCAPTAHLSLEAPHFEDAYFIEPQVWFYFNIGDAESPVLDVTVVLQRAGEPDRVMLESPFNPLPGENSAAWNDEFRFGNFVDPWPMCSSPSEYRDYQLVLTVDDRDGGITSTIVPLVLGCELI